MKGARSNRAEVPRGFSDALSNVSRVASPLDRTERIAKKIIRASSRGDRHPSSKASYTYPIDPTDDGSTSLRTVAIARARSNLFIPAHAS
jgi:hypothetical protein